MSVLLPTTTVRVLSPQGALDLHGAEVTTGWTTRGPFSAHIYASGIAPREQHDPVDRAVATRTADVDPAAWPISPDDRILDDRTGDVLEVVGATLVPNVPGTTVDLAHVKVTLILLTARPVVA